MGPLNIAYNFHFINCSLLVAFPNCKINLGLNVIRKRDDGYHDLETIFYPLPLSDVLEVVNSETDSTPSGHTHQKVQFSTTGISIGGNQGDNLCLKAYALLSNDFPNLPSIKMHLHKAIPMGAGLGGGSADGALTLMMLNTKFDLGLSTKSLISYALRLGSDCPFFIINKPCFATGRGETMKELELDLSSYSFVLVNPGIHITTGWAFSEVESGASKHDMNPPPSLFTIINRPLFSWKDTLINDFEKPVFQRYPEIKSIKDQLYAQGALFASMSGSGSTVFGIFQKDIKTLSGFPAGYTVMYV